MLVVLALFSMIVDNDTKLSPSWLHFWRRVLGNAAEAQTSDSQRRHMQTPPLPYSASTQTPSDWPPISTFSVGQRRRWRLSDCYIYLSRTLPSPSPRLHRPHNPAISSSATSLPTSSSSPTGGGYLVAIPNFTSAHSYENQHTLFVASSCA